MSPAAGCRRGRDAAALVAVLAAAGIAGPAAAAPAELANRCFALASAADGRFVALDAGRGYRADEPDGAGAAALYLKPTGPGTYLLHDQAEKLLAATAGDAVAPAGEPSEAAEWAIRRSAARSFSLTSTPSGRRLAAERGTGRLMLVPPDESRRRQRFRFRPRQGCARFPEAGVGGSGRPLRGTNPDGTVSGFMDDHLHITADMRAGGQVIYGESFDRFGIAEALGNDELVHGPEGSLDVTGNLLRAGSPLGTHDTDGWPSFAGWPTHDTYTHQQTYYAWLQRAWAAGLRIVVAQTVEDESLCRLEPLRNHSCDETETIKLQIQRLRALEDYVDAQSGGAGEGWFRIVTDPLQARAVVERGKLAVVIGMESSNPLGCSEFLGAPQCEREDIDSRLDELHRLGVRSMFITHWTDNAFGGAAFEGGANGTFISALQVEQTGHPFAGEPCGQADEAEGQCNARGLTELGRHLVERMMERGMLIEADHLSQKARESVLAIAEQHRYPLISSHTGTGGEWTPEQLRRLYALGGMASATPETAPELAGKILRLRRYRSERHHFGVALGTDTGGFAAQPGPRPDAAARPLRYPFRAYGSPVEFGRQRSGQRTYDLNADGVAHYGLIADLVADMRQQEGGEPALRTLFNSAEAYLQMWQRASG